MLKNVGKKVNKITEGKLLALQNRQVEYTSGKNNWGSEGRERRKTENDEIIIKKNMKMKVKDTQRETLVIHHRLY